MISMQIVNRNFVIKDFLLLWLFLLISLFLSLPAKGNVLDIDNEYCEGPGEKVTFTFWVKNAANPVEKFGCTVQYDKNIFEYMEHYKGNLGGSFSLLSVKEWWNGTELKINGFGGNIKEGDSGSLISLAFKLKKCEESTLELLNLQDDMKGWSHSDGFLKIKEEEDEPLPQGYYPGPVYSSLGWQGPGYLDFLLGVGLGYSGWSGYQYTGGGGPYWFFGPNPNPPPFGSGYQYTNGSGPYWFFGPNPNLPPGGSLGYSGLSGYQYGYYNQVFPYNGPSTYFHLLPPDYILRNDPYTLAIMSSQQGYN